MSAPDRRSWLPIGVAATLLTAVLAVVILVREDPPACATASDTAGPLLSPAEMTEQPDERLDVLTAAVNAWGSPFGAVDGGVGYDYDQWLHLYGVNGGLLAFTKNNAPVTMLRDNDLKAAWSLKPATKRIAWDASDERFLLLDLASKDPVRVGSFDLDSGERQWCVEIEARHRDGEPVSTAFLDDGDVLVALPGEKGVQVSRLSRRGGTTVWSRDLTGIGRADYLGPLIKDVFVAGGVEEYRLAEPDPAAPAGPAVTAYSFRDGTPVWSWDNVRGMTTHVVGVSGENTILMTRSAAGDRLRSLDATGAELWEIAPANDAYEATLRGELVLMRSKDSLTAYDATTGKTVWECAVPTDKTYFPYGFTLDQMPTLDATHVLMPTTTALRILDVTTGKDTAYPLPTDGVSTTYWPYQLAVTERRLAVVTNTGGVVAARE